MEYKYENLIRFVFGCERTRKHGADADIYRSMKARTNPLVGEVDLFSAGIEVGMVMAYVIEALRELKERSIDDTSFVALLEDYICMLLYTPSVENLERCLNEITELFVDKGWFVR